MTDRREFLPEDVRTIDILDLLHVLPRVWDAAHLFEKEGTTAASDFVRTQLLKVLQGQTKSVITSLRSRGTRAKLNKKKSERLAKITAFLTNNLFRMHDDEYLQNGYPIATGVIEGACRHVVKDRMERSGMRWKVPGRPGDAQPASDPHKRRLGRLPNLPDSTGTSQNLSTRSHKTNRLMTRRGCRSHPIHCFIGRYRQDCESVSRSAMAADCRADSVRWAALSV